MPIRNGPGRPGASLGDMSPAASMSATLAWSASTRDSHTGRYCACAGSRAISRYRCRRRSRRRSTSPPDRSNSVLAAPTPMFTAVSKATVARAGGSLSAPTAFQYRSFRISVAFSGVSRATSMSGLAFWLMPKLTGAPDLPSWGL